MLPPCWFEVLSVSVFCAGLIAAALASVWPTTPRVKARNSR